MGDDSWELLFFLWFRELTSTRVRFGDLPDAPRWTA